MVSNILKHLYPYILGEIIIQFDEQAYFSNGWQWFNHPKVGIAYSQKAAPLKKWMGLEDDPASFLGEMVPFSGEEFVNVRLR